MHTADVKYMGRKGEDSLYAYDVFSHRRAVNKHVKLSSLVCLRITKISLDTAIILSTLCSRWIHSGFADAFLFAFSDFMDA